jgi:hypothetical protein
MYALVFGCLRPFFPLLKRIRRLGATQNEGSIPFARSPLIGACPKSIGCKSTLPGLQLQNRGFAIDHPGHPTVVRSAAVLAQLIADTDGQENLVPYRCHDALYPVLAPLDDEKNIGTGLRFTFRIFTLANGVGPNRQWFRDPMEGELSSQGVLLIVDPLSRRAFENDKRKLFHVQKRRAFDLVADLRNTGV